MTNPTPEHVRADQLAYGREQHEAHKARCNAFRSPLYHALKAVKITPRRFNDTAQMTRDERE